MGDEDTVRWHHWERQLEKARREGMIEGLERALELVREYDPCDLTSDFRAEVERLKGGA